MYLSFTLSFCDAGWGPTGLGLAVVPALPYLFDHPVEHAAAKTFDWLREQLVMQHKVKDQKEL